MRIIQKLTINKPIEQVWNVLGNQFGEIDKWASSISHSTMSGDSKISGLQHTIRSLETNEGPSKQEITAFNPDKHTIIYEGISGLPFFLKSAVVGWSLVKKQETITDLKLDFEVKFKGLGVILTPLAKVKLGKVGDEILSEFKFYVENGTPHTRKLKAMKKSR